MRELRGGLFFRFVPSIADEEEVLDALAGKLIVMAPRQTGAAGGLGKPRGVTADFGEHPKEMRIHENSSTCRVDQGHLRRFYRNHAWEARGQVLNEFVPWDGELDGGVALLRGDIADRLRATPFTGYRLEPTIPVDESWREVKLSHRVEQLLFMGQRCDEIVISPTIKNQCPYCGHGPIACPDCRMVFYPECPKCGREYAMADVKQPDGSTKYVNPLEGLVQHNLDVLIGRDWDGSDFHGDGAANPRYLSKRALDWFLGMHAAPFVARPVKIDITGMTPAQLEKLETMKAAPPMP